jgi:hypothetical protein
VAYRLAATISRACSASRTLGTMTPRAPRSTAPDIGEGGAAGPYERHRARSGHRRRDARQLGLGGGAVLQVDDDEVGFGARRDFAIHDSGQQAPHAMARLSIRPPPAQIDLTDRHPRPRPSALARAWPAPNPALSEPSCRTRPGTTPDRTDAQQRRRQEAGGDSSGAGHVQDHGPSECEVICA